VRQLFLHLFRIDLLLSFIPLTVYKKKDTKNKEKSGFTDGLLKKGAAETLIAI